MPHWEQQVVWYSTSAAMHMHTHAHANAHDHTCMCGSQNSGEEPNSGDSKVAFPSNASARRHWFQIQWQVGIRRCVVGVVCCLHLKLNETNCAQDTDKVETMPWRMCWLCKLQLCWNNPFYTLGLTVAATVASLAFQTVSSKTDRLIHWIFFLVFAMWISCPFLALRVLLHFKDFWHKCEMCGQKPPPWPSDLSSERRKKHERSIWRVNMREFQTLKCCRNFGTQGHSDLLQMPIFPILLPKLPAAFLGGSPGTIHSDMEIHGTAVGTVALRHGLRLK